MTPVRPPANWPFPTYRGQPIKPPRQESKKEWLAKQPAAPL